MQDTFSKEENKAFNFGLIALLFFVGIFCFMAFSTHKYKHIDANVYHIKATFGRTDGLLTGDKVRLAGVDVGRVSGAELDDHFNAVLTLEIKDGILIPDDSSASIVSSGLMGSKYIEIEPGGSEEYITDGGQFSYTQDAMVLEELLDRIIALGKAKRTPQADNTTDSADTTSNQQGE